MNNVLIIEDDDAIAAIERDYLEVNGFSVTIATDGITGSSAAISGSFDLILLDIMLPGKDGFTVCREIRSKVDIPILMVTAKKEDIDKIRGLGLGADDYIVKPFSPNEMVARVQSNIAAYNRIKGGGSVGHQTDITVGALRINPKSHRVFLKEKEIELTNKEFELLLFLETNPDTVFNKETLYDRIWGYEAGDIATVAVHINRLREKIEDDPSNPRYIQTVWGAGYRFRA